jgi:aldehyde dehydrogenase (NAD+)
LYEVQVSDVEERTETSVELGHRAASRAEARMLIDGELVAAATGEEFDNVSPATGLALGRTAASQPQDMERAIAAARRAFDESDWSTNRALRTRCLEQLQSAIEADKDNLREELIAEVGCPVMTTQSAQLDWPLADALRYPGRLIDDFEWQRTLEGGGLFGERNVRTVVKEPVGVVAAITPSNFPIEVILNKLGPALATGNTVVLKPDPNTPWNATRLGRLIAEHTDIPPGVVNVVPTPSNEVAGMLGTDPRVDMISFTGSTAVGKLLMRQGADTMKRMFLELGGKSVSIVLDDANPAAILGAAIGVCVHAGQACAATTRMLVHRSLFDDAVATITAAYAAVPVGDPVQPETLVGPVISPAQKDRVLAALDRARRDGASITVGRGEVDNLPEHLKGGHYCGTHRDRRRRQQRGDRTGRGLRPGAHRAAVRRRRRGGPYRQRQRLRARRRGHVEVDGARHEHRAAHPHGFVRRQRRHVLRGRCTVRRLQEQRSRSAVRYRGLPAVSRNEDHRLQGPPTERELTPSARH